VAAGLEVGMNDVLVMVSVWVQVTVVEVILVMTAVEVEAALDVGLEVGGGMVVLFVWYTLDVDEDTAGVLVLEE
jgi:hypothetical protein